MDKRQERIIGKAIHQMETLIEEMKEMLAGEGLDKQMITEIEKYTSGSGNTTWKLYDMYGNVIAYIRQAQKDYWVKLGHWDTLNKLDENSVYRCDIRIETFKDGDFNRIAEVENFMIPDVKESDFPF